MPKGITVALSASALGLVTAVIILPSPGRMDAFAETSGKAVVLLQHPVRVTAAPGKNDWPDLQDLEIRVEGKGDRYRFTSRQYGESFDDALARQREVTRWRGPYFMIGYYRGGGNASRFNLDVVFALRKGRLLYLGEVEADSYKGGTFRDTYNKFELNELTSHAGAPTFPLVVEEKGGRLRVNLEKTWGESQGRFRENATWIQSVLRKRSPLSGTDPIGLTDSLLFNAVLAKYCQRPKELEEALKAAAVGLQREDPKLFDQFKDIVSRVIPGELPERAVKVVAERM